MTRAFVSVGSNIDPAVNTERALHLLTRETLITNISNVYQTEALDRPEQPLYYNCVVEIDTALPPRELKFHVLRTIEEKLGRTRSADKSASRTIDLDLIFYDDLVMHTDDLVLPDPDIAKRPFLAVPLHELAPSLVLPGSGARIKEIARAMSQQHMKPLHHYTDHIRKEFLYERKSGKD